MLKLVCGQNFVLFGHSGHELERFENLVIVAAVIMFTLQRHIHTNVQYSKN